MTELYLTAYDGAFLGPIAKLLGWVMDKIYLFLSDVCHVESIPLAIIVFTVIVYMCMFPLTYKQQKFSMLSRKMQPEINEVRKKYKNKTDQASQLAMNEETQRIYDKYGISPMGSCIQLLIQMPILFALYRVFWNVPAYISNVKGIFTDLVNGIVSTDGYWDTMVNIFNDANIKNMGVTADTLAKVTDVAQQKNYIIDILYKLSENGWNSVADQFPDLADSVNATMLNLKDVNYLFVLNISDTPWNMITTGIKAGTWVVVICALLIPLISYLTQMINLKLMPTSGGDASDQMGKQMKMMNTMMPLFSLFICFTVPVGLGFYWIMSSVVRIVQQFFLNKHFETIDLDQIIEKNKEKAAKKQEKRGVRQAQIYEAARMNTRSNSMASKASISQEKTDALNRAEEARANAKSGSLASKANLVKDFNERNNK